MRQVRTGPGPFQEDVIPHVRKRMMPETDGLGLFLVGFFIVGLVVQFLLGFSIVWGFVVAVPLGSVRAKPIEVLVHRSGTMFGAHWTGLSNGAAVVIAGHGACKLLLVSSARMDGSSDDVQHHKEKRFERSIRCRSSKTTKATAAISGECSYGRYVYYDIKASLVDRQH